MLPGGADFRSALADSQSVTTRFLPQETFPKEPSARAGLLALTEQAELDSGDAVKNQTGLRALEE
jgi:hypothetical protein